MTILEKLEKYTKDNIGEFLPDVRYFNGLEEGGNSGISKPFCTPDGKYKSKTLEQSLNLFLISKGY